MIHRDLGATAAATLALVLASGAWLWDGPAPQTPRATSVTGLDRTAVRALETQPEGAPLSWRDTDGSFTTVMAEAAFRDGDGRTCRPFTLSHEAERKTAGDAASLHGVACRDGNGLWRISPGVQQIAAADTGGFDRWLDRLTEERGQP